MYSMRLTSKEGIANYLPIHLKSRPNQLFTTCGEEDKLRIHSRFVK
jgi:hypothetical protein